VVEFIGSHLNFRYIAYSTLKNDSKFKQYLDVTSIIPYVDDENVYVSGLEVVEHNADYGCLFYCVKDGDSLTLKVLKFHVTGFTGKEGSYGKECEFEYEIDEVDLSDVTTESLGIPFLNAPLGNENLPYRFTVGAVAYMQNCGTCNYIEGAPLVTDYKRFDESIPGYKGYVTSKGLHWVGEPYMEGGELKCRNWVSNEYTVGNQVIERISRFERNMDYCKIRMKNFIGWAVWLDIEGKIRWKTVNLILDDYKYFRKWDQIKWLEGADNCDYQVEDEEENEFSPIMIPYVVEISDSGQFRVIDAYKISEADVFVGALENITRYYERLWIIHYWDMVVKGMHDTVSVFTRFPSLSYDWFGNNRNAAYGIKLWPVYKYDSETDSFDFDDWLIGYWIYNFQWNLEGMKFRTVVRYKDKETTVDYYWQPPPPPPWIQFHRFIYYSGGGMVFTKEGKKRIMCKVPYVGTFYLIDDGDWQLNVDYEDDVYIWGMKKSKELQGAYYELELPAMPCEDNYITTYGSWWYQNVYDELYPGKIFPENEVETLKTGITVDLSKFEPKKLYAFGYITRVLKY